MNIDVKRDGACRRTLGIEVDAERVDGEYADILDQYFRNALVPGFRKGKAPKKMVEQRFRKDISEEAKKRLISNSYHDALKEEGLEVVSVLDLQDGDFEPASALKFSVAVDVKPDFNLSDYKGIKVKGESTEPTKDEIEDGLRNVLEQFAQYEEIDDRPIERNDMAKIDYTATTDDGQSLSEVAEDENLAEREDYWVLVNSHAFLPEMEQALIGCSIGDETDVDVEFGDDFEDDNLAGRKAIYHVEVKAIKGKKTPELDETLLERLGFESEDALRERLRSNMVSGKKNRENNRLREEICEYLLKKTKIEVPQSEVEGMMDDVIKDIVRREMQKGTQREDIENRREEIFKEAKGLAEERLKLNYILARIADEEGIEVTDSDVEEYMQQEAGRYGMPVEQIREKLLENSSEDSVKSGLRPGKAVEMLLEEADVKRK